MTNEKYPVKEELEYNPSGLIIVDATVENGRGQLVDYLQHEIFKFDDKKDNQSEFVSHILEESSVIYSDIIDNSVDRSMHRDVGFNKAVELFKIADRFIKSYNKLPANITGQDNLMRMNKYFDTGVFVEFKNKAVEEEYDAGFALEYSKQVGRLKKYPHAVNENIMILDGSDEVDEKQRNNSLFPYFIAALSGLELRHYLDMPYGSNDLAVQKRILNQKYYDNAADVSI